MFLRKKTTTFEPRQDNEICSPVNGTEIDLATVSDPVFAEKMMGDGTAFTLNEDKAIIASPANGTLKMVYPTGHAFGVAMKDGTEILIHIGIDTVEAKGKGFKILKKQGETVKAGEPVIEADNKTLSKQYDMTVMCIFTNANGHTLHFPADKPVKAGEIIISL